MVCSYVREMSLWYIVTSEMSLASLRSELSQTRALRWPVRVQITCDTSGACHMEHFVFHVV